MSRVKCKYVHPGLRGEIRWLDLSTGLCYHGEDSQMVGTSRRFTQVPTAPGSYREWVNGELRLQECGTPIVTQVQAGPQTAPAGLKFDGGKDKWSLLRTGCTRALQGVIRVLTFGAQKYEAHSWRKVENGIERYRDALDRHLAEIDLHGPGSRDAESGELHIHHVACNALFLAELMEKQNATI